MKRLVGARRRKKNWGIEGRKGEAMSLKEVQEGRESTTEKRREKKQRKKMRKQDVETENISTEKRIFSLTLWYFLSLL